MRFIQRFLKKIDTVRRVIVLRDGREVAIRDVYGISGELFSTMEAW